MARFGLFLSYPIHISGVCRRFKIDEYKKSPWLFSSVSSITLSAVHMLIMSTDFLTELSLMLIWCSWHWEICLLASRLMITPSDSLISQWMTGHTAGRASNLCGNIPVKGYIYCPEFDGSLLDRFRFSMIYCCHPLSLPWAITSRHSHGAKISLSSRLQYPRGRFAFPGVSNRKIFTLPYLINEKADRTLFRVHSYFFVRESDYWKQELGDAVDEPLKKGQDVRNSIPLDETPSDFAWFLWVFYNRCVLLPRKRQGKDNPTDQLSWWLHQGYSPRLEDDIAHCCEMGVWTSQGARCSPLGECRYRPR